MVEIVGSAPPPAGTVGLGNLQVDAQTRAIWLGVSPAVDADEAVLVSDIMAIETAINLGISEANTYTDARIATRAPTVHTHAMTDIIGLMAYLDAMSVGGLPPGIICIWKSSIVTIPAGWALCNGTNGTPDLTDKFVIGAGGSRAQNSTGGASTSGGTTDVAGFHSHAGVTAPHAITVAQMAYHQHALIDPGHVHGTVVGSHNHDYRRPTGGVNPYPGGPGNAPTGYDTANTGSDSPSVTIQANTTGIIMSAMGGNEGHTHGVYGDGNHQHTISNVAIIPPYRSMCYIMKLA
jgi:hypothetical protein